MSALFNTGSDPFNFSLEYPDGSKEQYALHFTADGPQLTGPIVDEEASSDTVADELEELVSDGEADVT